MIHIRAAQPQDVSAIARLMFYAMEDIVYYFIGEEDEQKAITFLQTLICQTGNQYSFQHSIVAEVDGVVLGQLCCYPGEDLISLRAPVLAELSTNYARQIDPEMETQAGEVYIDSLAVSPLARGRGIGKMLLLYAIDLYCTRQHKTLGLLVDRDNPQAQKLYLQLGFREVGQKSVFGKDMFHLQFRP